jgi:hypothetical protein
VQYPLKFGAQHGGHGWVVEETSHQVVEFTPVSFSLPQLGTVSELLFSDQPLPECMQSHAPCHAPMFRMELCVTEEPGVVTTSF